MTGNPDRRHISNRSAEREEPRYMNPLVGWENLLVLNQEREVMDIALPSR